jgi:hypothetical protein
MDGARQAEHIIGAAERTAERMLGGPPQPLEDEVTKGIERYTAAIPSSAYLAVAIGAMGLSLGLQLTGRRHASNFIASWVPTWLIIGVYNKLVKIEGHDRSDRGEHDRRGSRNAAAGGISNRPLEEEQRRPETLPPRGSAAIG